MLAMSGEDEFGEFSTGDKGWGAQKNTNGSSDWLSYSDDQNWVSAVPNSEQPSWNASFPELPKELSNLLSEEIPNSNNPSAFTTTGDPPDFEFSNNGIGTMGNIDHDEFGDFESSFSENTIVSTTAVINSQPPNSDGVPTDKTNSWEPNFTTASNFDKDTPAANEPVDDEFGDFEGTAVCSQPQKEPTPEFGDFEGTTIPSQLQKESSPEFGGFVSSTTESKEEQHVVGDDDFGSFEAVQFVAAPLPPSQQPAPPISVAIPPITAAATFTSTALPSASFSEIVESCFHVDQVSTHQKSSIDESITVLTEQSRSVVLTLSAMFVHLVSLVWQQL